MVIGHTEPGATVRFADRTLRVSDDGVFVFGFHRDDPPNMSLEVEYPDKTAETIALEIAQRQYDIQRIDGLPQKKVSPPAEVIERIQREAAAVRKARARDTGIEEFVNGFLWPVDGPISGVYGSQRVLNGKPRQPHYGVDVAAPTGTPVAAPAAGTVSFAEPDLYFSGGTLMIDHGHGLASAFLHMQSVEVKVGERVERGQRIGTVGATGRATGAHLDWRVNWFEKRLDPQLLTIIKQ
ncbi:M23 family metallopeptidase [Hwanghaeella grinnelliae]|uniref:M23 family metallopeptidase n=2 Tax=Hwanghaeella grinnelliae TaxID=2500179 RepID=A0A3S2VNB7_9PROT|nr:M23 family metallopeptidase [Hwanghaeella grinnelliae]